MRKIDKKIKIGALLIMAVLLVVSFWYNTDSIAKSKVLYAVYNTNDCDVIQANVTTWADLDEYIQNYDDMKSKVEEILKRLDIKGKVEVERNTNDDKVEYTVKRNAKEIETSIKIQSEIKEKKTHMIIDVVAYENSSGIGYIQKKIEEIHDKENLKYKMNITLAGRYNKEYDKKKYDELAKRILTNLKAKKTSSFETEKIYSIYGYTDYIKDYVMVNGEKVNVNVALRYNEYENQTYLYVATPIITTDY